MQQSYGAGKTDISAVRTSSISPRTPRNSSSNRRRARPVASMTRSYCVSFSPDATKETPPCSSRFLMFRVPAADQGVLLSHKKAHSGSGLQDPVQDCPACFWRRFSHARLYALQNGQFRHCHAPKPPPAYHGESNARAGPFPHHSMASSPISSTTCFALSRSQQGANMPPAYQLAEPAGPSSGAAMVISAPRVKSSVSRGQSADTCSFDQYSLHQAVSFLISVTGKQKASDPA